MFAFGTKGVYVDASGADSDEVSERLGPAAGVVVVNTAAVLVTHGMGVATEHIVCFLCCCV